MSWSLIYSQIWVTLPLVHPSNTFHLSQHKYHFLHKVFPLKYKEGRICSIWCSCYVQCLHAFLLQHLEDSIAIICLNIFSSRRSLKGPKLFFFFSPNFIGVQFLHNAVLVSAVEQSESARWLHIAPLFWIAFPFRSPQSTEQGSLWYSKFSQLSILYRVVCICQAQHVSWHHSDLKERLCLMVAGVQWDTHSCLTPAIPRPQPTRLRCP